jgi:hypothetical protein
MLTIKNYKLGEGAHFLGWQLDSVMEIGDNYVFLWTDIGSKGRHQYQIFLGRRFENPKGELPMMMFTVTPGSQPLWSGVVNRLVLEYHWEWIEKCVKIMNQYKPYK